MTEPTEDDSALAVRAAKGDPEARDQIARDFLPIIGSIARNYRGRGLDHEDLVGEGCVGLTRAMNRFEERSQFRSYAICCIVNAIRDAIHRSGRPVRIPYRTYRALRAWHRAGAEIEAQTGREPTADEIANRLGMSAKTRRVLTSLRNAANAKCIHGTDIVLPVRAAIDRMIAGEESSRVESAFGRMPRYRRCLIGRRFGLDGKPAESLEQVAAALNRNRETVRRHEILALDQMRETALKPERETRKQRRARIVG